MQRFVSQALAAATIVAVAASGLACTPERAKSYSVSLPEFHGDIDANGLRVIILPDPTTALVEIDVRYEVGGREDPIGKSGIAHMVEHIMFQQKPTGPDQPEIFKVLQQIALHMNAYTTWDTTHYQNLVTRDHLEDVLAIEATRMHLGCKTVSNEQFEREREVVRNEYRQNFGTPQMQALLKIRQAAYTPEHPYYREVIGNDTELAAIKLEDICVFMEKYYTPSRATLIVAGNVTIDEVRPLIGKYFAGIPAREAAPRVPVPAISLKRHTVVTEMDVDETMVAFLWATPRRYAEGELAVRQASNIIVGLTDSFATQWEFASFVQPISERQGFTGAEAPFFGVVVGLKDGEDPDKAIDAIDRAARQGYRYFDEAADFDEAVARSRANLIMSIEDLTARTDLFGDFAQFDPEGGFFAGELKRLGAVSASDIRAAAKRTFDPDKAVIAVIKKKKGASRGDGKADMRFSAATNDDRSGTVVDPAEAQVRLIVEAAPDEGQIKRFTLGNGMKVVMKAKPLKEGLPIMNVDLVFGVGYAQEGRGREGLARVAAEFISPTVGAAVGGDIASGDALSRVGAQTGVDVSADTTIFSARGLNIYDEVLVKGLERMIAAGEYNQEDIETQRDVLAAALKAKSRAAQDKFARATVSAIYGEGHPYASTGTATPDSLGRFGRDAAVDFKRKYYVASNATIVVTGRFDPVAVEQFIRDNFGSWSDGDHVKPVAPPTEKHDTALIVGVDNEPIPSATVQLGFMIGASPLDGQYAARLILAEMLTGRVRAVREQLGASYGMRAGLQIRLSGGAFIVRGQVDMDRLGETLKAIHAGLDTLRKGEDFDAEFARARREVLKGVLSSSGTVDAAAQELLTIATFGLADGYFAKLARLIGVTSPEQIKALAQTELAPHREVLVILGARAQVDKALAEAGLTATRWVE